MVAIIPSTTQGHPDKPTKRKIPYIGDRCNFQLHPSHLMEKEDGSELELMPPTDSSSRVVCRATKPSVITRAPHDHSTLDLSLSISFGPLQPPAVEEASPCPRSLHTLKQHTAEQVRLVAVEQAYVESMRELTRRELEMAEKEFARARMVWERARQEVERVERMKEMATRRINSSCMEITCRGCHQRFRPL